jgi:acetyl esterase/lipase
MRIFFFLAALLAPPAEGPAPVVFKTNIVYGKAGAEEQRLDLARPAKGKGPFPAVVCLHGGGWQMGQRSAHHRTVRALAGHGYVAVTVTYRLAPKHRWPAQLDDARRAVRWLRANAKDLNVDPERIGALGDSAGGHLALLLGLSDAKDGGPSARVRAVVNYYGPTDLRTWKATPVGELMFRAATGGKKGGDDLLRDLCGTADRKAPVLKEMSPIVYVDARAAAVLTLHGTEDHLVPLAQAEALHAALGKAGVPQRLEVMKGQGHGWAGKEKAHTDKLMLMWFDKHLKGKR